MSTETEPNSGLYTFENWTTGQSGWGSLMVENMMRLGRVGFQLAVLDRGLTSPPGSPADGDRYIVATSATGAWAGHDNEIAVWDDDESEWVFYAPSYGWRAVVLDESVVTTYMAGSPDAWTSGQPV